MQTILELLAKRRIEDIIKDIEKGDTCVLIKPRGVKLLVSSDPLSITDKRGRKITNIDLLSSNLYVTPYMRLNRVKINMKVGESYEMVHNYNASTTYLTSIKLNGFYVNDYKTLFHRASQFELTIPIIEGLTMDKMVSLIQSPGLYFGRLGIKMIAESVMLLNPRYQATINNDYREKNKPATAEYIRFVHMIFDCAPEMLSSEMDIRIEEIFEWAKRVKKLYTNKVVKKLNLPQHVIEMQDFTMTILPEKMYKFLRSSQMNMAIFRTILFILVGKGYNGDVHAESAARISKIAANLSWDM